MALAEASPQSGSFILFRGGEEKWPINKRASDQDTGEIAELDQSGAARSKPAALLHQSGKPHLPMLQYTRNLYL